MQPAQLHRSYFHPESLGKRATCRGKRVWFDKFSRHYESLLFILTTRVSHITDFETSLTK